MPAIITHHLFGLDALRGLDALMGQDGLQRDAFLLGNQGPDPLFCLKALPAAATFRDIGSAMHCKEPTRLLAMLHRQFLEGPWKRGDAACRAYALGFACHYLLDSIAHPLVYAQQNAFCDAGVAGLTRERGGREVHAIIETDIDEYMLTRKRGVTVSSFSPHRETLKCPNEALSAISTRFSDMVKATYSVSMPKVTFASSVALYRTAQLSIDSKREGLRKHLDYARLAGKSYLHIQALTHTDRLLPRTPFTNDDHVAWPHPFIEGATVSDSFDELYARALDQALEVLPAFASSDFSFAQCEALTGNVNFRGERVR